MSIANTHFEEAVADLSRRIAEPEMRSTAAADALATLIKTDVAIAHAERHLNEEMDALLILRRQLAELLIAESG